MFDPRLQGARHDADTHSAMCVSCNTVLPASMFNKEPRKTNGLGSHCRPCINEKKRSRRAAYRQANPIQPRERKPKPPCTFDGCDKPIEKNQLCSGHNAQLYRGQELIPLRPKGGDTRVSIVGDLVFVQLYSKRGEPRRSVQFDLADLDKVGVYTWCQCTAGYAVTNVSARQVKMHRLIMDAPSNLEVDHINGDKLDNRRSNLRLVTREQQAQNKKHKRSNGLPRNVYYEPLGCTGKPKAKPYRVQVHSPGLRRHIGDYATLEEAVIAARKARSERMTHAVEERHL